jgi:branched-chain amino acid transport system permease protein
MEVFITLFITGVGLGALYFLVAAGLSLIYGLMDVLNFAHGAFLTAGAYATWYFTTYIRADGSLTSYAISLLIAGLVGALFAVATEQILIKYLYNRHIDQALVTVGLGFVATSAYLGWFGTDPLVVLPPVDLYNVVQIGEAFVGLDRFLYIGVAVIVLLANFLMLRYTRIGLIIRAGVENRNMVTALGIDVRKAFTFVFFIGGFAAGLGGALATTYASGVGPTLGDSFLIYAFITVVIGGMGSVPGTAIAAVLVGTTQVLVNYYVQGLGDFVVVLLLALVLLVRPQGLLGKVVR